MAMLPGQEILVETTPTGTRAVAAFDLSDRQLVAVGEALDGLRRERYALAELDVDQTLALAALRGVSDQVETLVVAGGHGTLRIASDGVHVLCEAVGTYTL